MIMIKFLGYISLILISTTTLAAKDYNPLASAQRAFEQGQIFQAIELWENRLPQLPSSSQKVDVLLHLTLAYQALGLTDKSLSSLKQALPLTQEDKIRESLVLGTLSDVYLLTRQLGAAKEYADKSVKLAANLPPLVLATALNYQGNVLSIQGNVQEALDSYRNSLVLAQQANDPVLSAKLRSNILQLEFKPEDLKVALSQMQSLPDSRDKVFGLLNLGYLAIEYPQMKLVAHQVLQEVLQLAQKLLNKQAEAYAYGYLGKLYEQEGHYVKVQDEKKAQARFVAAEQLTRQAMFLTRQSEVPKMLALRQFESDSISKQRDYRWQDGQGYAPEMLYRWQWQLGRLRQAQNDLEGAIIAFQQAVNNLQIIRYAIVQGGYRMPSQASQPDLDYDRVYFELADLLLQSARHLTGDRQRDRLIQARDTLELLKQVELENYFQDDCVIKLQEKMKDIDTLIDDKTAVLYPMIFPDRVELLLSLSHRRLKQFTVPNEQVNKATRNRELRDIVKALNSNRQLRKSSGNSRRIRENTYSLYTVFIKPIINTLETQHINTLIVVPDNLLRTIPFATLYDGKQFLIERYALAITPGLTLVDAQPLIRDDINMLTAGLSESVQNFSALPHVPQLIAAINHIYPSTRLLDQAFQAEKIKALLKITPYNMILFATHGHFGSNLQQTFLLTYNGRLTLDQLEELMHKTQFREQPVELLTLAACQTAEGDEKAALGLAGIAVKAGARSVVASLWLVAQESTIELMTDFHRELFKPRNRLNKAQALQKAQINLINKLRSEPNHYKKAHPYYWAPFLLIGNWF
jgi:CHAT domain-containing protein/tetratricopeptide (TPR) repeat protein